MKITAGKFIKDNFRSQMVAVVLLIIGYFAVSVLSVLFAMFSQYVVDSAVDGNMRIFYLSAACMVAFGAFQIIINMICRFAEEKIKAKFDVKMRSSVFAAFLYKKYSEETKFHSGEIINRLSNDTAVVADGIIGILPHFFQFSSKILFTVIVLFILDWKFALIVLIGGAVSFVGLRFFKLTIKSRHKKVQEADGKVRAEWQDSLGALPVVKAFSVEEVMAKKSEGLLFGLFNARMRRRSVAIFSSTGLETVFRIGNVFAIIWGCLMLTDPESGFTFGTLTAVLQLLSSIHAPFNQLSNMIPKYYQVTASAERLCEILSLEDEQEKEKTEASGFEKVVFDNVTFGYGDETVIENASFEIRKGETVGIHGISGGGKSTLLKLMLGLYTNYSGEMTACFENGSKTDLATTERSIFAYVPQDAELFSGTVRENITFKRDYSEEKIKEAITASCAEFIYELPLGLDTVLTERGGGISEGQRQRLSVCRAVLFGAPVLILDEATSALDVYTEKQMLSNLKELGKTIIMVNHRPAAQSFATRSLKVSDKKVFEKEV